MESVSRSRNVTLVARLLAMAVAGLLAVGLVVGFAIYSSSTQAAAGRVGANATRDSAELVSSAAGEIQTLISRFRY